MTQEDSPHTDEPPVPVASQILVIDREGSAPSLNGIVNLMKRGYCAMTGYDRA